MRALVLAHGWNATAYQLVNRGIEHWFSRAHEGVTGYVRYAGVRVVAGAPVCALADLSDIMGEFESDSASAGDRVCYFGAEERLESLVRDDPRYAMVSLGAQPAWHPARWPGVIASRASVRAQLHRAVNKGVRVTEWESARAENNPELRRVLLEWLGTRGLPPLHFLVEPETLGFLVDRRVFVAERAGQVVGFLVASPVPARKGWLVEQIIRGNDAPNGTNELLIDAAMRALALRGAEYVTLGLSPLSELGPRPFREPPFWLRTMLRLVRAHGRRFYNFRGLEAFKAKFAPERWEPVYAIAHAPRFSPRMLHAIAGAFSGGSPVMLVMRAMWSGLMSEGRRARRRLRKGTARAPVSGKRQESR